MPATRAEVARAAGVSPAVVSYVLNGGPRPVSAQSRARVLQAVAQLGYRPNRIAQALRESRTHSIAMLMPDHVNPHFAELAQAVEEEAFARDYMLTIGTANNDTGREQDLLRSFVDRQVDGLLLISAMSSPDVRAITTARIPVVLLDRAPDGSDFSSVVIDNRAGARMAGEHLLSHGRSRLACISGPPDLIAVQQREAGWFEAVAQAGADVPQDVVHTRFSRSGGYQAMRELLSRRVVPDAVLVSSDAQAMGAVRACAEIGARVGDDLALVSFDGTEAGYFHTPRLTAVDQNVRDVAREAIEVLLGQIATPGTSQHRILEPSLRIGESCGCTTSGPMLS